MMPDLP